MRRVAAIPGSEAEEMAVYGEAEEAVVCGEAEEMEVLSNLN